MKKSDRITWDGADRFLVDSRSRSIQHVIELEHYAGNGACVCENFSYDRVKEARRCALPDGPIPSDASRCNHIRAVVHLFSTYLINHFAKHPAERDVLYREVFGKQNGEPNE